MIEARYKIVSPDGKKMKEMVVKKNDDGSLIRIEDELGNEADTMPPDKVKLTREPLEDEDPDDPKNKFRSPTLYASDDTFILTHHNPTCGWYWWRNEWHYICTG